MDLFEDKKQEENADHEQLSLFDTGDNDKVQERNEEPKKAEVVKPADEPLSAPAPEPVPDSIPEKNENIQKDIKAVEKAEKVDQMEDIPAEKTIKKKDKKKKILKKEPVFENTITFGKSLQDMRVRNDFSVSQVAQLTRIKDRYIELLEMEQLRTELPSVYVLAYARKLCSCYQASKAETDAVVMNLKNKLDNSVPAEMIENIHLDYEVDEENQRKIRHIVWFSLAGIILFILLIGASIFMLTSNSKDKSPARINGTPASTTAQIETFDQEKLKELQKPIIIEATELPPKTD
jgi:hypothetical protein